jgi:flavin reductase (DIM6/NTAB) family NADH-FMN oxidoreductase RutF
MSEENQRLPKSSENIALAQAMKQGMRQLASGIAVIATRDKIGMSQGMTVTALTSLSDHPPSLLVCLNRAAVSLQAIRDTHNFSINILNNAQQAVSDAFAFAPEGEERFKPGQWQHHATNAQRYLPDALAVFFCIADRFIDYGTHCIVVARIQEVRVQNIHEDDASLKPLVYYDGGYRQLQEK